jgi:hypothetical protein
VFSQAGATHELTQRRCASVSEKPILNLSSEIKASASKLFLSKSSEIFRRSRRRCHSPRRSQISMDLYNYLSLLIWFATLFMQDASL